MILVNGCNVENITNDYWQQEYLVWEKSLSTLTLLKWIRDNYGIGYDEYTCIEYWFIEKDNFCEVYYYNEFIEIIKIFRIVEYEEKYIPNYLEKIIINKNSIIRDLVINKILS